jgi:tripartite-type tricarboxylate transporter receptor subunit TctC
MKTIPAWTVRWSAALIAAVMAAIAPAADAQAPYPSKPIRVIVGIAPGSVTDIVMRAVAQELAPRLGQPLVIENRPGGNMIIGADACAKAAPDGYTICVLGVDALSSNVHTIDKLPYDPERDLKPVTNLFYVLEALVVNPAVPANSVAELRALAIAKPGSLNFGTLGPDSSPDIFLGWLREQWKADMTAVPYKGGGPIATAVMAGEIQLSTMGLGNFAGGIEGGKLRALAVGGSKRLARFPDVPTWAEAGLGAYAVRPWWGLVVPAGTPDALVARLNAEFTRLFAEPKFSEFLAGRFLEPATSSVESFAAFLKADRERAGQILRAAKQTRR